MRTRRLHRAMALATAIMISMILLILGLAFLTYLERDYRFAGRQEREQEAFYLAYAGLQYQRNRSDILSPGPTTQSSGQKFVPATSNDHFFVVTVDPDGTVHSQGVVQSGLVVVAQRFLVVAPGKAVQQYVDQSE